MAWNEPGKGKDPWGGGNRNSGGGDGGGPPDLDQIWKRFRERFGNKPGGNKSGGGNGGGANGGGVGGGVFLALVPIAFVVWLATGLYVVQPGEKGVVLRLGQYTHTTAPGWHWHLPYPVSTVYKVDTQQVRRASNRAVMLTKDENIVDVEISVQYRISNAMNYLFQLQDPENTVQQVLRSAVREIVGTSDMNQVIQEGVQVNQLDDKALANVDLKENSGQPKKKNGLKDIDQKLVGQIKQKQNEYPQITDRSRAKLPDNVRRIMQYTLNKYHAGIDLLAVNVQYAQPPEQVQGAFQEAIKAREEEERAKNIARAYARDIVARAQGDKAQMIAQARAYKQRKIDRAEGQAARFSDLLAQYEKAPEVTRERLYLETMGDVLSASHVILNDGTSNSMTYLPLDKILEKSAGSKKSGDNGDSDSDRDTGSSMTLPNESDQSGSGGGSSTSGSSNSNVDNLRSRSRNS
ncbi:protease modulator HflK [Salinisphaera hydrothermalis]|uniref:HflK protein n=1 Tax=Salinisphaera hydrothermalis (strain C41B8) TaxID=1304275 RepID=A0A084ILV3_SALHC|nr:protease modulator HflK [Salinisphaera hydrothermalis]KEZ77687.1 HflK protein [Salinisphaera hydrothermalis C41B8]